MPAVCPRNFRNVSSIVLLISACLCFTLITRAADDPAMAHPLDPLNREEISAAVQVLKASGKVTDSSRDATIVLREPPKAEVLNFKPGDGCAEVITNMNCGFTTDENALRMSDRLAACRGHPVNVADENQRQAASLSDIFSSRIGSAHCASIISASLSFFSQLR